MAIEKLRIRVVFEDRRILSKSQKREGLSRSWVVLNPQCHRTVSDISAHLLRTFNLIEACPHGVSLSMEGFVLPPFESSCVLKDKDVVCVKKKKASSLGLIGDGNEDNAVGKREVEQRNGLLLLANEEFQEEIGGYKSESEESEPEEMGKSLLKESNTKKRKASSKRASSKRKKCKLGTVEEREDGGSASKNKISQIDHTGSKRSVVKEMKSDINRAEIDEKNNDGNSNKYSQQEEHKRADELSQMSDETKKMPSRSARRKKAKRRWLREKAQLEKQELEQNQLIVTPNHKSLCIIDNHITEENHLIAEEQQQLDDHGDDAGDDVIPVEVRPGHIRFKPLVGTDETFHESETPVENFSWNGIMSKKKGQKWGKEKTASAKRYAQDLGQDFSESQAIEVDKPPTGQIDYEKLMPYRSSPKEGDIIAYRLIELSSSWTPEISSFRIGKITRYDSESTKVILLPVPEFPIEKKMEEDDSSAETDTSLYKEDGSLEIEFSSLLDVRTVYQNKSDAARLVSAEEDEAAPKSDRTDISQNGLKPPIKENENINAWEEISEALSAKKAELCESNGWNKNKNKNKNGNSSGGPWSYRALRSSALGPVMSYLRSQNEL